MEGVGDKGVWEVSVPSHSQGAVPPSLCLSPTVSLKEEIISQKRMEGDMLFLLTREFLRADTGDRGPW